MDKKDVDDVVRQGLTTARSSKFYNSQIMPEEMSVSIRPCSHLCSEIRNRHRSRLYRRFEDRQLVMSPRCGDEEIERRRRTSRLPAERLTAEVGR